MSEEITGLTAFQNIGEMWLSNPFLIAILIVGWTGIIISHFKIHWRISHYVSDRRYLNSLTDGEIIEQYDRHLEVEKDMRKKHPDFDMTYHSPFVKRLRVEGSVTSSAYVRGVPSG